MTNPKALDHQFNMNEWTVILGLCVGIVLVLKLPRRFSTQLSIIFFLCGAVSGFIFDQMLSVIPVSFYDVNDTPKFEFIDFMTYLAYGPVSYLFFYVYDALNVKVRYSPVYIMSTTVISTGLEWVSVKVGIFRYDHGYWLGISFVIYLMIQSVWVWFYFLMQRAEPIA